MSFYLEDRYRQGDSLLHRWDPRLKVVWTFLFILTVSLTPFGRFVTYGALLALALLAAMLAGLGPLYVLRRSIIALPFALAAITLPFTVPGRALATLPIFGGLEISEAGTIRFASILIKSWISVQMAILLVAVTAFPDILWSLRALRLPQVLIAIVSFMYRYLFVIADEASRLLRARAARSATVDDRRSGGDLWWRGKVAGRMVGSLMLRSFERSERIYQAMAARGYQGQIHVLTPPRLHRQDMVIFVAAVALLIAISFLPW
jgi:cobalt/nickel transport system permease protein